MIVLASAAQYDVTTVCVFGVPGLGASTHAVNVVVSGITVAPG
jgi:hypothetical protein